MVFHGQHQRLPPFKLGSLDLPFASSYRYLGVVFSSNGRWAPHVEHISSRSNQRFATCVAWAQREKLHLAWIARLFQVYVLDAFFFGAEFIATDAVALRAIGQQLRRLGRRILGWPSGSPNVAVLGELGWLDAEALALRRAASLWSRLASRPADGVAVPIPGRVFHYARRHGQSWAASASASFSANCVPDAALRGVGPGQPPSLRRAWMRQDVSPALRAASNRRFHDSARDIPSLHTYLASQPHPQLLTAIHNRRVPASDAREWGLARCGHHIFSDGRISRHGSGAYHCLFCDAQDGSLCHALAVCPTTADLRHSWALCTGLAPCPNPSAFMRSLLSVRAPNDLQVNAANVRLVAQVCRRGSLACR